MTTKISPQMLTSLYPDTKFAGVKRTLAKVKNNVEKSTAETNLAINTIEKTFQTKMKLMSTLSGELSGYKDAKEGGFEGGVLKWITASPETQKIFIQKKYDPNTIIPKGNTSAKTNAPGTIPAKEDKKDGPFKKLFGYLEGQSDIKQAGWGKKIVDGEYVTSKDNNNVEEEKTSIGFGKGQHSLGNLFGKTSGDEDKSQYLLQQIGQLDDEYNIAELRKNKRSFTYGGTTTTKELPVSSEQFHNDMLASKDFYDPKTSSKDKKDIEFGFGAIQTKEDVDMYFNEYLPKRVELESQLMDMGYDSGRQANNFASDFRMHRGFTKDDDFALIQESGQQFKDLFKESEVVNMPSGETKTYSDYLTDVFNIENPSTRDRGGNINYETGFKRLDKISSEDLPNVNVPSVGFRRTEGFRNVVEDPATLMPTLDEIISNKQQAQAIIDNSTNDDERRKAQNNIDVIDNLYSNIDGLDSFDLEELYG